jgi:CRP/FNR family transcriptional regulator, cyclic AMP receptor protein
MSQNLSVTSEIVDILVGCGLFDSFSPNELQTIAHYCGVTKAAEGTVIFNEGDAGTFMCIIHRGNVVVRKTNSDDKCVEVAVLRKGKAFGEMAALDEERRSATCVAATDCVLLTLSRDSLDKMVVAAPSVAVKVIRVFAVSLSKRLRLADYKLTDHHG